MDKKILWRIQVAVVLTSLGVFYYLVFLFYLSGGIPIEKIHEHMTDGWPAFIADNVPYIAPIFLCIGLGLGYTYNQKRKPKPEPEPVEAYKFEFNTVPKDPEDDGTVTAQENAPLFVTKNQEEPEIITPAPITPEPEPAPVVAVSPEPEPVVKTHIIKPRAAYKPTVQPEVVFTRRTERPRIIEPEPEEHIPAAKPQQNKPNTLSQEKEFY